MPDDPTHLQSKFYLTTPIYYVNARPHIGHAYTTIVADVLARRHRLLGDDTFFLTGTDEHGQKIERSAAAAGIPPQQFADEVSAQFQSLWDRMGLTYDKYIRTTDPAHKRGVQKLFRTLYDRGFIYLSSYTGQYSIGEEMFVDGPPGTIGPDGRPTETVTEENFFFKLSEFQLPLLDLIESNQLLITPDTARNEVLSFLRGNVYELIATSLPRQEGESLPSLTAEVNATLAAGDAHPLVEEFLRRNLLARTSEAWYLPGALKDLSISRSSFTWGVPVPDDIQRAAGTTQKHIIYVWLDALANYITAIGYGEDTPEAQAALRNYWPADLHLVGKEITRFHCVYWPAFLLALNPALQHDPKDKPPVLMPEQHAAWAKEWVPKKITANGWLLFDNSKMSKSRGNVVRTETILDAFGDHVYGKQFPDSTKHERDLFATDVLRYFLLREIPFGQDGSFSFDALVTRYNADLANGYGNLVSRVLNLVEQNFPEGWIIPVKPWLYPEPDYDTATDTEVQTSSFYIWDQALDCIEIIGDQGWPEYRFTFVLAEIMKRVGYVDTYLTFHKPWTLAKSSERQDRRRLIEVLYVASEAIRLITLMLHPVMPATTAKVWQQLGLGDIEVAVKAGDLAPEKLLASDQVSEQAHQLGSTLQPGIKLGPLSPIFPRADKSLAQVMIDMEEQRNNSTSLPIQEATNIPMASEASLPTNKAGKFTTETMPTTPDNKPSTDPGAPPRTSSLDEPSGTLPVAGSAAEKPALPTTPGSHTQAPASGIFATPQQSTNDHQQPATITIDDFMKVELRVAQILVAERIPKADKLLRLEVDLGTEKRQILSGIAQHYTPEELLGRRIVVVSNLAPRKMRGLDSHGMLLAASEGPEGKPILATFKEDVPLGSRVR